MVIRPTRREDVTAIDDIYQKHHGDNFTLPGLNNSITDAVVVKDNKIVGFGVVKVYAEAVMILDLDQPKADRLQATEKLMHEAIRACVEAGIDQLHVSVQDTRLVRLLEKRYEFKPVKGQILFREI